MNVISVLTSPIKTNTYIVYGDKKDGAVLIDTGDNFDKIVSVLEREGVEPKAVLITHAHFDHVNATAQFQRLGIKVYMHKDDLELLKNDTDAKMIFKAVTKVFDPDVFVNDNDILSLCGLTFKVIHTPGHSAGSVCYVCEDAIFSGDTLFYLDVGNTRFKSGNKQALTNSIRNKLFALDKDYKVYPGHGKDTTLFFEKENNPYV